MSEELLLDPDSVVLKQAEIQANGDFKETDTIEGTAVQVNGNQAVFTPVSYTHLLQGRRYHNG